MSSSRPIMQKELEGEITRLPLALTRRQSENLINRDKFDDDVSGEDEDESEVSSEPRMKSQLV